MKKTIKLHIVVVMYDGHKYRIVDEIRCDIKKFYFQNNYISFIHCDDEEDSVDLPETHYINLDMEENEVEIVREALPNEFNISSEELGNYPIQE